MPSADPIPSTPRQALPSGPRSKQFTPNRLQQLRERGKRDGGLWLTLAEVSRVIGISESLAARHECTDATRARPLTEEDVEAYARLYKVKTHQLFRGITAGSRSSSKPR